MTLAQLESRFFELTGKLAVGQIAEDEFKREMEKLRFQDQQGRWWMIGAQSGRWYYYDGSRWRLGQPPEVTEPVQASPASPQIESQTPVKSSTKSETSTDSTAPAPSVNVPVYALPLKTASAPIDHPIKLPVSPPVQAPFPGSRPDESKGGILSSRMEALSPRAPTLAERPRQEITHVHVPHLQMPQVHVPPPIRRYPPNFILVGAVLAGLLLVAVMWLAVDNLVPGKPISSVLGRTFGADSTGPEAARTAAAPQVSANVDTILRVGDDLSLKSQYGPAFAQYQAASKLAPNNADVYSHWARALSLSGRIQEATNAAQRATRLDPNSAEGFAELSRVLGWGGQSDLAIIAAERAVQLDSKSATAHAFLAEAYLRGGRQDDAKKESATALGLDDVNVDAHRAAAWLTVILGQKDVATTEWRRVIQLGPDVSFYHFELGQVFAGYFNDSASAVGEFQKAIQLFPPYVPAYIGLGRVYLNQNQPGPALAQYQKALTFDNSSIEAYVGLGLALQKQGSCPQAIPYYKKSLELNPNGNEALHGLAECGALAQNQQIPTIPPAGPAALAAVPTAIVEATVVPLAGTNPSVKPAPAGAGGPSTASGPGRIVFAVYDGKFHLNAAGIDGKNRGLLAEFASQPAFSPDGSRLLYMSWQTDQRGIHRLDASGIIDDPISLHSEDSMPSWSPDGTRYVYATRAGQGADITKRAYRLRISDPTGKPAQDPPDFVVGQTPAWGPTNKIAFRDCGFPTDVCGLALINADGSSKTALISNMNAIGPAWSPDGKLIAYTSDYGGNWDIYIVSAGGGSPARLTTDATEDGLPTFSSDGKQIAFLSHRGGPWAIWAMGIDGSNQHKLFDLGGDPAGPVGGNSGAQPGQVWYEQRIAWH